MKHVKHFEANNKKVDDQLQLFKDLLNENPLSKDHDFYAFIAKESFKETKDGLYKKTLGIENMVRMSPDIQSISAMKGLEMRAMVQHDSHLYHIWLPIEFRDQVEGKGQNLDSWVVELIDKYKMTGSTEEGRRITKDVRQRRTDMNKYNL